MKKNFIQSINSLKNKLTDQKKLNNDLITNLNEILDENKENLVNFNAVKKELEKAKKQSKIEEREEKLIDLPSEENYNKKILAKDKIIEKLLTEVEELKSSRKIRTIGGVVMILLIGVLIVTIFKQKKKKKKEVCPSGWRR